MTKDKRTSKVPITLRPELALRKVAKGIIHYAHEYTENDWNATVLPETDGSISIRINSNDKLLHLIWREGKGMDLPGIAGGFSIVKSKGEVSEQQLLKAVHRVLSKITEMSSDFVNIFPAAVNEDEISLDDLNAKLSSNWLAVENSGWFSYKLKIIEKDEENLRLSYDNGEQEVSFIINADESNYNKSPDKHSSDEFLILLRQRFALFIAEDSRTQDQKSRTEHQVERALVLALTRSVPNRPPSPPDKDEDKEHGEDQIDRQQLISKTIEKGGHAKPIAFELPQESSWRQFMIEMEHPQFASTNWQTTGEIAYVSHSDRTCMYMRPYMPAHLRTFFNYPWTPLVYKGFKVFTTDILDSDLISDGGEERLSNLLENRAENGPQDQVIVLQDTCIPKLLGQDMQRIKDDFEEKHDTPVLQTFTNIGWGDHSDGMNLILKMLLENMQDVPQSNKPSLNLIGFNLARDLNELKHILESLGIEINSLLLPNIDLKHARKFKKAWLQVHNPIRLWQPIYKGTFEPIATPNIKPFSPFGIEGTIKWFEAIALELDLLDVWTAYKDNIAQAIEEERSRWQEESKGLKLGFIMDIDQFSRIWDGERNFGVPLLSMLKEFGFGITVFCHEQSGAKLPRQWIETAINGALDKRGHSRNDIELIFFSKKEELHRLLENGPEKAIFSEYYADPRIAEAGKAIFSLADFEKGFDGARRTFKRLIRRCNQSYYNRLHNACCTEVGK